MKWFQRRILIVELLLAFGWSGVACAQFSEAESLPGTLDSPWHGVEDSCKGLNLPNGNTSSLELSNPNEPQIVIPEPTAVPIDPFVVPATAAFASGQRFVTEYDNGFVISPIHQDRNPFELRIRGWGQLRHHFIDQEVGVWTDRAGNTFRVRDRNLFEVERARLILSGFALDPRLTYLVNLDGDTDGADAVDFFDYWWGWQATDAVGVQLGKRKVPGSRQWILSARHTRMIDRPMACDFFRPDRTVGIFANGKFADGFFIEGMVGNGYRTANLTESEQDNRIAMALTSFWDPFGSFGDMLVDYESRDSRVMRLGHSFVYASQSDHVDGAILNETDFIRLADGTRLATPNALLPGQTARAFDTFLYGVDLAWKRQGWSFNSEVFFRWLGDFRTEVGPINTSVFQKGFYVEGGKFLVPKKFDLNFRYAQVSDFSASASEYALGSNWFPLKNSLMKLTLETAVLDGAPLNNTGSDILVGDDGILYRSQFQVEF